MSLTTTQRRGFEEITAAINDDDQPYRFFFLDGPGGTGKKCLYNTLIATLSRENKVVLSFAMTGIAADLL